MQFTSSTAIMIYAIAAVVTCIALAWWRWIEAPDRAADGPYAPRHERVVSDDTASRVMARYAGQKADDAWAGELAAMNAEKRDHDYVSRDHCLPCYATRERAGNTIEPHTGQFDLVLWQADQDAWRAEQDIAAQAVYAELATGYLAAVTWLG